jgi:hypothetical protein
VPLGGTSAAEQRATVDGRVGQPHRIDRDPTVDHAARGAHGGGVLDAHRSDDAPLAQAEGGERRFAEASTEDSRVQSRWFSDPAP